MSDLERCPYYGTKNEPCWGEIEYVEEICGPDYEDCWVIIACTGHSEKYDGGDYIKENDRR